LVLVASANAADMAPAYVKAGPPSWTGFYIGAQGGFGVGSAEESGSSATLCNPGCNTTFVVSPALHSTAFLIGLHGGGTAGFNWQSGPFVFGVEGDISGANLDGTAGNCSLLFAGGPILAGGFAFASCRTSLTWFATATGRLGLTIHDALIYAKGGAAWARYNHDVASMNNNVNPTVFNDTGPIGDNRVGFTVGAGIEYAFWSGWSAKLEYDYLDFGTKNIDIPVTLVGETIHNLIDDRERVHVFRAGLNYRFNWWPGPVVTKY
jgi:outer membrane immunogenic protein